MQKESELSFHIIGRFKLSGSITEMKEEIGLVVKKANMELLKRGAPKGCGAEIVKWDIDDDVLTVDIKSDRHVRAHDALLRLRKPLANALGKHRVGIRGIEIEKFTIQVPTEGPFKEFKIPFVKHMHHKDGKISLALVVTESHIEDKIPDRIITLIMEKIAAQHYGGKDEHWKLLWSSKEKAPKFTGDPTQELINRKWIRHFARGQWIYGPQITKVFRAFEHIIEREILNPLGYQEMILPKAVTWDVWKRSGHAKAIYPEMYYICPPKTRDPEYWEEVMDYYKITNDIPLDMIREKIGAPIGGLCYAQCPPAWMFFKGETIADDEFPIRFFDRSGTSHRYESGGIHGIERLDEFHRIEVVWMGSPEQVIEGANKLHDAYAHIFNDMLDLQWRRVEVTPWFMAQEGLAGKAENEGVGTTDYEAYLPYKKGWLEFQNVSINGDKYPKGFNVKLQSKGEFWSGCSGIGLERWGAAFFAQKGLDPDDWPNKFRKIVGELPDVFKFL